jgi:hypothetical protein
MATSTKAENGLNLRSTLHAGNARKGIALLLLIAAVGGALLLAPALRKAPETQSPVRLPSMSNIPPAGSLHIESPPERQ